MTYDEIMIRHAVYSVDTVFDLMANRERGKAILPDGATFKIASSRIQLFHQKGKACVACGIEGEFFALESCRDETPHLNLYAINEDGEEILMTKDHIFPKSKGGRNEMANYQTMCAPCNSSKADKVA